MKVALGTVEVCDDMRRLIAEHYGHPGLASRSTVRNFLVGNGTGALDNLEMGLESDGDDDGE